METVEGMETGFGHAIGAPRPGRPVAGGKHPPPACAVTFVGSTSSMSSMVAVLW